MEPSKKSPAVEAAIDASLGVSRRETIQADMCVPSPFGCGGVADSFRDAISEREYTISGMCQDCQDSFFGV